MPIRLSFLMAVYDADVVADPSHSNGTRTGTPPAHWLRVVASLFVYAPALLQALLIVREYAAWKPMWAWYPDPGYNYLLAGAALVSGGTPGLVYHPGTSFQWLIGGVERLTHVVAGEDSFGEDVVARPEFYAQTVGLVIAFLYLSALVLAAFLIKRSWGLLPSLVFQLLMLWGLPVIADARYQLWPEALALSCAVLVIALCAPLLARAPAHVSSVTIAALGIVSAIGVTSKVIFAPLVALILIAIPWRRIPIFVVALLISIGVILASISTRLSSMWDWFTFISLRPGRHGQVGEWSPLENFLNGHAIFAGFLRWYVPVLVTVVAATVILAIVQWRNRTFPVRPSLALLAAFGVGAGLAIKESEVRDLIVLIPILSALTAHLVLRLQGATSTDGKRYVAPILIVGFSGFLALHGIVHQANFAQTTASRVEQAVLDAALVETKIAEGTWGLGYNVWTPANAIMFGSNDALMFGIEFSDDALNPEIRQEHPNAVHFDHWSGVFQGVDARGELHRISCAELQSQIPSRDVGIIVDSTGHVTLDSAEERIVLADGVAQFEGPEPIGQYFAYRLTSIACSDA